ncbi:LCCL domain-containing protein [Histoplasma capsulatum H143]|uniref:LCCL domain-containing protein n=1 Tax=Ajellomyces capsulatus (strain H143) TaxID=544712 RepID=C6HFK7_AJECH|nr:LCCL domain-containing protein [Histoplasma capsulatum H143]
MARELWDDEEALSGRTVIAPLTDDEDEHYTDEPDEIQQLGMSGGVEASPTTLPMPVWLAESSKSFHWKWVPLPFRQAARSTVKWLKGPDPPRVLLLNPLFPNIQSIPIKLVDRFFPKRKYKICLLLAVYFIWFLPWALVQRNSASGGHIEGYGKPVPISCGASYWAPGNECGLNGYECRPFNRSTYAFRCPAFCSSLLVLEPYVVGNVTVNYQPLIVGGPMPGAPVYDYENAIYRADSKVCQAAIHAGVISDSTGGCGVVELTGAGHSYFASKAHGISSIGFPSTFPKSFRFLRLLDSQSDCPGDLRWPLFAITAAAIVLVSLFTTSPAVFFFTTFFMLILHVGLVSDPPDLHKVADLFSLLCSRLLPASFIAYVLYIYCARPLLQPLASPPVYQFSKTILYLGPAFIGALNNYTFALWIPIQRLTPHDIKSQPGAPIALAIVITIIISIVLGQAWHIRQGGLFFHYLKIYLCIGGGLIFLLVLPQFRLRIHHYILGMLLMPGTAFPTRPSIIYQGLLLGLFVNGVARWGFASIIETPSALGELPGPGGSHGWWGATSPNVTNSSVHISLPSGDNVNRGNGNITFRLWEPERMETLGVDGISVLVNDVERWRGFLDEDVNGVFVWHRQGHRGLDMSRPARLVVERAGVDGQEYEDDDTSLISVQDQDEDPAEDLFFRFAFLKGSKVGLYGGSGIWNKDGSWINPPPPRT